SGILLTRPPSRDCVPSGLLTALVPPYSCGAAPASHRLPCPGRANVVALRTRQGLLSNHRRLAARRRAGFALTRAPRIADDRAMIIRSLAASFAVVALVTVAPRPSIAALVSPDSYLCYSTSLAKGQPKLPKGLTATLVDALATRGVAVSKDAAICNAASV